MVRFMESYRSQLQMRIWSSGMNCLDEHSPFLCYQGWPMSSAPIPSCPYHRWNHNLVTEMPIYLFIFHTGISRVPFSSIFFSFFFFEELEEESVLYLIYDSISLCITAVSQGRNSHRTGAWRQELEQRPQKSIAYRLLPTSSSASFLIEPAQGWPHPQKTDPFFNNHWGQKFLNSSYHLWYNV